MVCVTSPAGSTRPTADTLSIVVAGRPGAGAAAFDVVGTAAGAATSVARYARMRTASATVNAIMRSVRKTGRNVGRTLVVTEDSVDTTRNSESEGSDFCAERISGGSTHEIRAVHRADRRAQRAETGV